MARIISTKELARLIGEGVAVRYSETICLRRTRISRRTPIRVKRVAYLVDDVPMVNGGERFIFAHPDLQPAE